MNGRENVFKTLIKDYEEIKDLENINRFSGDYEEKIRRCIDDSFERSIQQFQNSDKKVLKTFCLAGEQLRKRKKIIAKYVKEAKERFSDKYQDSSIEFEFIALNSALYLSSHDAVFSTDFIYEAAALYILYEADDYGNLDKIIEVLPKDEEFISTALMHPEATDLCFSNELIASLVSLLQSQNEYHRKDDETYILTKRYTENKISSEYVTSDFKSDKEKVLYILSLMEDFNVKYIVDKFKEDCWRLFELCLEISNGYQIRINKNTKEVKRIIDNLKLLNINKKSILINEDEKILKYLDSVSSLDDAEDLLNESIDIYNKKHLSRIVMSSFHDSLERKKIIDESITEILSKFEIDDPFETAFAYTYLLSTNDDFVWLINICLEVLKTAADKLPWSKDVNYNLLDNEAENKINEERMKTIDVNVKEDNEKCEIEQREFYKEIYKLKYTDAYRWNDINNAKEGDLLKWNLPQFLFDYTSIILPRTLVERTQFKKGLPLSGFKKEEVDILTIFMDTLSSSQYKETLLLDTNKEEENEDDESLSIEEYKEANKNKSAKIEMLKNNLSDVIEKYNKLKKQYEFTLNNTKTNSEELYRLREQIYNIQNADNSIEEEPKNKISYPYTAKKRSVVIGGSDTWINKMKEKLKNVTFISSSVKVNPDVLKHAEVIWLQTIAMKHADFYAITSFNDKYNLPIYYFSYSNIDKCLEQFIKEDQ